MAKQKYIDKSKKELILLVSSKVFAKQGFHDAKISQIAKLAGIGTGTVYLYFETKENILKELMVQIWTAIANEIEYVAKEMDISSIEKVYECSARIIILANNRKETAKMVLQEFAYWNDPDFAPLTRTIQKTKDLLKYIIDDGIDRNEINNKINPEYAVPFLMGGIWHLIEYVVQTPKYKLENVLEQAKIFVTNAFKVV